MDAALLSHQPLVSRLQGVTYVDYAGAGQHSDDQALAAAVLLNTTLLCNPHSVGNAGDSERANSIRRRVLDFVGADARAYVVVWTASATAALKLLGEHFAWRRGSRFAYHENVHNSALGIRGYAARGEAVCEQHRDDGDLDERSGSCEAPSLFVVSGECNFSGTKPNLPLVVERYRQRGWAVCVDAAALAATNPVDLATYGADFACVSFYKVFGLPSGLGALVARRDALEKWFAADRPYFGGGTVEAVAARNAFVAMRRDWSARYEDGTVAFANIATLAVSLDTIASLGGMAAVQRHTFTIASWFASQLLALRHWNGVRCFDVYGHWSAQPTLANQGSIVAFNGHRADGSWIGYSEVSKLAGLHKVMLRTGCFCNAGACEKWLGLEQDAARENLALGHRCWDDHDVLRGKPTGAVRVSFGWPSTMRDAEAVLLFLRECFVESCAPVAVSVDPSQRTLALGTLQDIVVYPVKSCQGMHVRTWPLGPRGLLYDREWVVVGSSGTFLTQKTLPALCRVGAAVDLLAGTLTLTAPECAAFVIALHALDGERRGITVCGDSCIGLVQGGDACSQWLERALGQPCTLVRMEDARTNANTPISFANEAQYLVVSEASLTELAARLEDPRQGDASRFRANFVIGGDHVAAHLEDDARSIVIGTCSFRSIGPCTRCEMVCIDAATLTRTREPLKTLASYRRKQGRILFGSLFANGVGTAEASVSVGDRVKLDL